MTTQPANNAPARKPARKPEGELRRGWTTGTCAAAGAAAAFRALLENRAQSSVTVRLPKGEAPTFALSRCERTQEGWRCGVIKDAGDDPDVTHGAEIITEVHPLNPGDGIVFKAGDGVGTVTLAGLPVPVGEPAINPGPRAIITDAVNAVAEEMDALCDLQITISIPGGAQIAEKTMNPRLGIKGGLSILGTTGIVIPFSCASWINSIHRGIDVARLQGIDHLIAATGSTSEAAAMRDHPELPEQAFIDMGDFAGGLLKYLRRHPAPKLSIVGGAAKLAKLAQGHLDLHSKRSSVDMQKLAETALEHGADAPLANAISKANTTMEALELCNKAGIPLADAIARGARETAMASLAGETEIRVVVYDRAGNPAGTSERGHEACP
ncbi:cobalt-precorrin-5B (C(1))-methyltransferase [Thalassospiraceae bacterium LMO-JJ14]|nr:cobalt-precorrin-5B (C(1))-methyltransferase [Thalassospiraceae bacterium LMO-JJ14]